MRVIIVFLLPLQLGITMRRAVITGLGPVTPIGIGAGAFYQAQLKGRSGVHHITSFDPADLYSRIAGEVRLDLEQWLEPLEIRWKDRFTQLATVATMLALKDSGLELEREDPSKIGVIVGSGFGGVDTLEQQTKIRWSKGPHRLGPMALPNYLVNAASTHIAIKFGLMGPNTTIATACSTGNDAIALAYRAIQHGEADVILTGGSEAPLTPAGVGFFTALRALSHRNNEPKKASRPFSQSRDGFVIAEGAGVLVLEEYERARARGARIYAEIIGFGRSCDAHHPTQPHPEGKGAVLAIKAALLAAQLEPKQVNYINAHGTSTQQNDLVETIAIKQVFGDHAYRLAVSATKSMIGHSLGAAGAIEAIATAQAIHTSTMFPTINLDDPDPELDLDYVSNTARQTQINYALSNAFAFGGQNCVLVFRSI